MGYGGILSGLVQGYAGAVIGNEKKQYEEKQKKQQQELQMYQMILNNPEADPATKTAALGKIEETIHGGGSGGKKSSSTGILSKIGGLLTGNSGSGQSQPQLPQVAPNAPQPSGSSQPNPQQTSALSGSSQPNPQAPPAGMTPPPQKAQAQPGLTPPPIGFTPHFYSPEEKAKQKTDTLDAEEQVRMKYDKQREELRKETDIAIEKARAEGRQYKSPAGPKPGGMPWETGQTIVQDGVQTWVPTNPPKDVGDAHQMAESLARTNGKTVLENYDSIWTMKAQGLSLDAIGKQLRNTNTQSEITDRDKRTSREGYVMKQDVNGEYKWVKKPEVASPNSATDQSAQSGGLTPLPAKPGAPPAATKTATPPSPSVIDTGVQGKMPKGKSGTGTGSGGPTPKQKTALDAAEKHKNDQLLELHKQQTDKARKTSTQADKDRIWAEEKELQGQIQQNYRSQRTQIMSGGMTPPPSKTIKMRAPDGSSRDVPSDQVEHFKSLGASVVQ